MDDNIRYLPGFGQLEYADKTLVHPLSLAMLVACAAWLFSCRRGAVFIPIFIITCFITSAQRLSILTVDFTLLRIMVMLGCVRIWMRKEYLGVKIDPVDKWVCGALLAKTIIHTLLEKSPGTLVYEVGQSIDLVGFYIVIRCTVRSLADFESVVRAIALIAIPISCFFLLENKSGKNLFAIFGGVPFTTEIREGELRAQGSFPHPIIAGAFWASLIPIILSNFWSKMPGNKVIAIAGAIACMVVIYACSSSTPIFGALFGLMTAGMFLIKDWVPKIRNSIYVTLVLLHFSMQMPVWHLITRVKTVGGSTAYFRYQMIDAAVNHVNEWWLLGTRSTAHWFFGAQDITNHFVLMGVQGGLVTLGVFTWSLVVAFKKVGSSLKLTKVKHLQVRNWFLGASLCAHTANFIGVSYFGQGRISLYLTLSLIVAFNAILLRIQYQKMEQQKARAEALKREEDENRAKSPALGAVR